MKQENYQLPAFDAMGSLDQFDGLIDVVKTAKTQRVFSQYQHPQHPEVEGSLHQTQVDSMCNWLHLLGYLKPEDDPLGALTDREMEQAILLFQQEANLPKTGLFDQTSWSALHELGSFEPEVNVKKWYAKGQPLPVLLRVIRTRLQAFGFLPKGLNANLRKTTKAMGDFVDVYQVLRSKKAGLAKDFSPGTVAALLDHDDLLETIADFYENEGDNNDYQRSYRRKVIKQFYTFLVSFAKVELWLNGYDLLLNGTDDFKTPKSIDYEASHYITFHAVQLFWSDLGYDDKTAWELAHGIDGDLFVALRKIVIDGKPLKHHDVSAQVYTALINEDKNVFQTVWEDIKSIGFRIWDGIKRIASWVFGKIKKAAAWIKNIGRLAYHFALRSFPVLDGIVKSVSETITIMTHRLIPLSKGGEVLVYHDLDFDLSVLLNATTPDEELQKRIEEFGSRAELFNIGIRIMGDIIATLTNVIKKSLFGLGWFGFILALVKLFREVSEIADLGSRAEQIEAGLVSA